MILGGSEEVVVEGGGLCGPAGALSSGPMGGRRGTKFHLLVNSDDLIGPSWRITRGRDSGRGEDGGGGLW